MNIYDLIESLGFDLHPWQRHVVGLFDDDQRRHDVPHGRMSGGTFAVGAYITATAKEGKRVLYYSQLQDCSDSLMYRLVDVLNSSETEFKAYWANGKKRIEFPSGGVIYFKSLHGIPSGRGRGMVADVVVLDTPRIKKSLLWDILPVMSAVPDSKLIRVRSIDLTQIPDELID